MYFYIWTKFCLNQIFSAVTLIYGHCPVLFIACISCEHWKNIMMLFPRTCICGIKSCEILRLVLMRLGVWLLLSFVRLLLYVRGCEQVHLFFRWSYFWQIPPFFQPTSRRRVKAATLGSTNHSRRQADVSRHSPHTVERQAAQANGTGQPPPEDTTEVTTALPPPTPIPSNSNLK